MDLQTATSHHSVITRVIIFIAAILALPMMFKNIHSGFIMYPSFSNTTRSRQDFIIDSRVAVRELVVAFVRLHGQL